MWYINSVVDQNCSLLSTSNLPSPHMTSPSPTPIHQTKINDSFAWHCRLGHMSDNECFRSIFPDLKCCIFCDNHAAVIKRNLFFVIDSVRAHKINLNWVSTKENIADFLTKPLGTQQHCYLINSLFGPKSDSNLNNYFQPSKKKKKKIIFILFYFIFPIFSFLLFDVEFEGGCCTDFSHLPYQFPLAATHWRQNTTNKLASTPVAVEFFSVLKIYWPV
ncbi:uncharacterized protein VP01_1244g1 [Puccinia sorghi]|uniref:Uncharacterized protein n=1 Tax=Puccinia sorghi TaxID=27349 RepID=A0A0L6VPJ5_9BASI|nr:uncharacterized protein VP01_1244g1 [Puccinia sorghi]